MTFDPRPLLRRLGRPNARPFAVDEAKALFTAMLEGTLDDVQLGAAWMGLRIKGETPEELVAFLAVAEGAYRHWTIGGGQLPIIIPSYNGARQLPNLTPLLAELLARRGVPVVIHGVSHDPSRVTSAEVFAAMDNPPCVTPDDMTARHRSRRPAFVPIETLAPSIAKLLDRRWTIGARGSMHTVVKMINPLSTPALRIVSVTHPDYVERMRACFASDPVGILLLRGAEGEAVAHPRRALRMEWIGAGREPDAAVVSTTEPLDAVELPDAVSAAATADWIARALAGRVPIPPAIFAQVDGCLAAIARSASVMAEA